MTNLSETTNRRQTTPVKPKLEKNLAAYFAAAGAAGVGVLALTQSAEAKVVYTATNITVTNSTTIDLNHDGIADFAFEFWAPGWHSVYLDVMPLVKGNAVRGVGNSSAACGFLGVPVGPGQKFGTNSYYGHGLRMAAFFSNGSSTHSLGPWANVANRYLGFKFLIDGQIHYGWARLSVSKYVRNVELTGYAYETTPNTKIIEGHTSGPEKASSLTPSDVLAPVRQPATLGMLARGAEVIEIWRREEGAAAN
jgi:hypothetical protein